MVVDPVSQYLIDGLKARQVSPDVLWARRDHNFFCEYCFVDGVTGAPIIQADHHRMFQDLAAQHDRLVVWYPVEHGKTTQAKMFLCRVLGELPDQQFAFVSSKARQAEKLVGAVRREIEGNGKLREVYPHLRPQRRLLDAGLEQWGNTAIRIEGCPRGTRDPSLAAYGLDGQILGSRLHGAILDNVLDHANTRTDEMRRWVREVIENEIINRVYEGGFIIILDTAWYADDMMHVFAKRDGWHSIKLDAMSPLREGDATLWPAQWPRKRLDRRLGEIGQTAFDRQYRNQPMSESKGWFKEQYWTPAYGRCPWLDSWHTPVAQAAYPMLQDKQVHLRTGVDLATRPGQEHDLTSMATVVARGHRRQLVNLWADRVEGNDIIVQMVDIYRRLHRPVNQAGGHAKFIVEDNAAQVYIVQMMNNAAVLRAFGLTPDEIADIRIEGRTTTSHRRDLELGIPAIASGLETGRWDIAAHNETDQLREEMRVWSPEAKHYGDRLMSVWFAYADLTETAAGPSSLTVGII